MPICTECLKQIVRSEAEVISCCKCNVIAHLACVNVNITKEHFEKLKKGSENFICYKYRTASNNAILQGRSSITEQPEKLLSGNDNQSTSPTVTALSPAFLKQDIGGG